MKLDQSVYSKIQKAVEAQNGVGEGVNTEAFSNSSKENIDRTNSDSNNQESLNLSAGIGNFKSQTDLESNTNFTKNNNRGEKKMASTSILNLNLIDSHSLTGNSDIEKVKELLDKHIKDGKFEDKIRARINTLLVANDKDYPNVGNLYLSTIILYAVADGVALVSPIIFPQSQPDNETVQSIMDYDSKIRQEIANSRLNTMAKQKNFYTPDIVVDKKFKDVCKYHVERELNTSDVKVYLLPPFIVSQLESIKTEDERAMVANKALIASINSIYTTFEVNVRENVKDASIKDLVSNGSKLQLDLNIMHPDNKVRDLAGNIHRANFQIIGTSVSTKQDSDTSWNQTGASSKVVVTSGYMDAVPFVNIKNQGFEQVRTVRLLPHIIVTNIAGRTSTLNVYLLGLLNATLLYDKSASLMVFKNNIKTQNDPSSLDNICAIGNELSAMQGNKKQDVRIDLKDKNLTDETVNNILKEMFLGNPMLSVDITPYSTSTNSDFTILKAATSPNGSEDQVRSINDIITSVDILTDGHFSRLFNPDNRNITWGDIFARVSYFPAGYYYKGSEAHDIREIDLTVIAKECVGAKAPCVVRWTDADNIDNREECIMEKLDILNKGIELTNNTFITSRGYRVTFNARFVSMLVEAAIRAGLVFDYKAKTLDLRGNSGYEHMADLYSSALYDAKTPLIRNTGFGDGRRFGGYSSGFGLF